MTFRHPLTGSRAIIRTPYPEELFANKFCTMLSRKGPGAYPRDVFDVATFSTVQVDHGLLVDVVFVDALMCELDLSDMRMRPLALEQMGSLRALVGQDVEENEVLERATLFFEGVQEVVMERDWKSFQEAFWADGSVVIDVLENPDAINPAIEEHPLLRWVRERPDRAR